MGKHVIRFPKGDFIKAAASLFNLSYGAFFGMDVDQVRNAIMQNLEITEKIILAIWEVVGRDRQYYIAKTDIETRISS